MNALRKLALVFIPFIIIAGCTSRSSQITDDSGDMVPLENPDGNAAPQQEEAPDLSVYKVRYFEPGKTDIEDAVIFEDDEPFAITGYGPVDFLPAEVKRPSIYLTFSQPVVPLSMLGEPMRSSNIVTIDPPLDGVYRWYGTRLLSFDPDEEAIPQRRYAVSVSPSVQSLGGKSLSGIREFSFRTESLSMVRIIPGDNWNVDLDDVPLEPARNVTVMFNHPVNPDVVTVYLAVRVAGGPIPFTLDREFPAKLDLTPEMRERSIVLRLEHELGEESSVEFVLMEGARSEPGYLGSADEQSLSFMTIREFEFLDYDTYSWTFPRSPESGAYPVFLRFSHPVDPFEIHQKITTRPKTEILPESVSVWGRDVMVSDLPFPPESTYTLLVSPDLQDIYGRSLGRGVKTKVEVPEARSYSYFPNTGSRMLEAEFPHRIAYEYQNVFDGVWKIDRISDPYSSFDGGDLAPYDFSEVERNVRHFEVLDLDPWLNEEGRGAVGISWNFAELDKNGDRPSWGQNNLQLQITDLGITTRVAYNRILVLVTTLSTGEPVGGSLVSIMRDQDVKLSAETDRSGIAVFDLDPGDYGRYFQDYDQAWKDRLRIRAEYGLDSIEFVPNDSHNPYRSGIYSVSGPLYAVRPKMETLLFTDRGLYRPGERIWFRGIDMDLRLGEYEPFQGGHTAQLRFSGYGGDVIDTLEGYTSPSGGFYGSFELSKDLDPGYYVIAYTRPDGQERTVYLQIAFFENLNFEVTISGQDTIDYLGDTLEFDIQAGYLSGGSLAGGRYDLYWTKEPAYFTPPGTEWEEYRFGPIQSGYRQFLSSSEGELDSGGSVNASQLTTGDGVAGMPYTYQLEARVQDAGRQEISARKRKIVHPASFYIGGRISSEVKSAWSTFVSKGEELLVPWVLVDPEGKGYRRGPKGGRITAELLRVDWKIAQQQGVGGTITTRYEMVEEVEDTVEITDGRMNGSFAFTPSKGGLYRVRLSAADEADRKAVTGLEFYATGSEWIRWGGDSNLIDLQADGDIFTPGETANILVKSPLPKGQYIVTVEREGIFDEYIIDLEGSAQVIGIPVREEYVPVIYVSVASYSVRSGAPTHTYFTPDLDKPKGYYGVVPVAVDSSSRRIDIDIDTGGISYLPGGKAEIVLKASMMDKPVAGAEITFLAVDRGVVDLIDYHVPDPVEFFYSQSKFPLHVKGADSRSLLIDPVTYEVRDLYGGDAGDEKGEGGIRSNFVPTAVFEPFLITDKNGVAKVLFDLPDSLTTYRCTAVAVEGDRFGHAEEELRVQQPINVISLLPKRIRVRDTVTAGVMVTNMDREPHEVTIAVSSDLVKVDGDREITFTATPGATKEITFNLYAEEPGDTQVIFSTRSDVLTERLVREIFVEKPTVRETVTTTGRIEAGETQQAVEGVVIPGYDAVQDGSLKIDVSPSLLSGLFPAVEYLLEYPHGCFEQRASRLMPVVLFGTSIVRDAESFVWDELEYWAKHQLDSGGFPFWPESAYGASYYVSLRIAHLLKIAEERGYGIPAAIDRRRLVSYIARPDDWIAANDYLMLYSLYIQSLYGVPVHRQAADFEAEAEGLNHSAHAFLGLVFSELGLPGKAAASLQEITRYLKPGTRSIDLTPKGDLYTSFYGRDTEQIALLLMLQTAVDPGSDLTNRIAGTLLTDRRGGSWTNTAATNWALLSLSGLMMNRDETAPNVTASVTLDEKELWRGLFQQIDDSAVLEIGFDEEPVSLVQRDVLLPLLFEADGGLYYTASLAYDLPAEVAGVRDEGFSVYTSLERADGTPHLSNILKLGETYRQRVVVSTSRRRSYTALRVPVPSGAVILDTSFTTTGSYKTDEPDTPYRERPIEKIYDNEVRYYFDDLAPGSVEVVFLFRAVSRGVFPTPPAVAECMYEPEVFGRSGGRLFILRE